MRVTHFITSLDIRDGGPSRSVPTLCAALTRQGVSVAIETLHSPTPVNTDTLRQAQIQIHYSRESLHTPLRLSAEMKRRTAELTTDLMHGHGLWQFPVHYALHAARRRGLPSVLSPRGMLEPGAMQFSHWKKTLALRAFQWRDLQSASCLHATAEAEAATLRALGLQQPICIIPNGIDVPPLSQASVMPADDTRTRRIAFLSRIHPKKGLPMLLNAWRHLQADFPNWQIEIAGTDEDNHEQELKHLAATLNLTDRIVFRGPLFGADKAAFLRDADLFVLPTLSENFGMVVAEALAYGTPVLTTRGAPWQTLTDHQAGWWIDVNETALIDGLRQALSLTDAERHAMGQRGRHLVQATFSTDTVGHQMAAVYDWLINRAPIPDWVDAAQACA